MPVYGPRRENIGGVTDPLGDGDMVRLARPELLLQVFDVPGHTSGHIAYYSAQQGWLFCGDTLFAGGCGRLFEGTPAQMTASLAKLAALPGETKVYCAHEYTMSNLRFAQEVDPRNAALGERVVIEQAKRERGEPTVPSSIALEQATNPFLRYREPAIVERLIDAGKLPGAPADPVDSFAALRLWKNVYR